MSSVIAPLGNDQTELGQQPSDLIDLSRAFFG